MDNLNVLKRKLGIHPRSPKLIALTFLSFLLIAPSVIAEPGYTANVTRGNPSSTRGSGHDCNDPANLLTNCGFETGDFTGWVATDLSAPFFPLTVDTAGVNPGFGLFTSAPTEGTFAALNGFDGNGPGTIELAQDVSIPPFSSSVTLQFDYRAGWDMAGFGATLDRTFEVQVQPTGGGAALQTDLVLTAGAGTTNLDTGDQSVALDLSAFEGQDVRIVFVWNIPENFTGPGFFQLDNVLLLSTPEARATFPVDKDFDDDNPAEVEVTISCNTGLPLEQTTTISEGDGVVFVVRDFEDGELDCEVTEDPVPAGYLPEYFENGQFAGDESCTFENVRFGDENSCLIEDNLQQVDVVVTKEWIDENPQFAPTNFAEADYSCSGEQFGDVSGQLTFLGEPATDTESFSVFPHWNGGTTCTVTEAVVASDIEADDSDCQGLSVTPGSGASCTIVNTRLFAGIPTLSQYGLTLLALLMLGVGFVAYRRIV